MNNQKTTLENWILEESDGEPIECVVIGENGWLSNEIANYKDQERGKKLSWDEARKYLQYEFDDGFGSPNCNSIYAWTKNKVIFVSEYDGSTSICSVPRNPIDCDPKMFGG